MEWGSGSVQDESYILSLDFWRTIPYNSYNVLHTYLILDMHDILFFSQLPSQVGFMIPNLQMGKLRLTELSRVLEMSGG